MYEILQSEIFRRASLVTVIVKELCPLKD